MGADPGPISDRRGAAGVSGTSLARRPHRYSLLKATILSRYGYSLPARAQQYHDWHYDPGHPVRPQVNDLARRTRCWLVEGEGPALLEHIILDRCIRDLPPEAKRYVAEQRPRSVENVIAMLENHQTTQEMMRASQSGPSGPPLQQSSP